MKTSNIVWTLVIAVVIIFGVWYFMSSGSPEVAYTNTNVPASTDTSGTDSTGTTSTTNSGVKSTTFKSLVATVANTECVYEQVDPKYHSTNVVYLADGKFRGEFRTSTSTGSMANLAVYDGLNLYVWKEGSTKGTLSQPKTLAELADVLPADLSSAAIFGTGAKNVSWDCHPWSKNPAFLVKPAGVTFK